MVTGAHQFTSYFISFSVLQQQPRRTRSCSPSIACSLLLLVTHEIRVRLSPRHQRQPWHKCASSALALRLSPVSLSSPSISSPPPPPPEEYPCASRNSPTPRPSSHAISLVAPRFPRLFGRTPRSRSAEAQAGTISDKLSFDTGRCATHDRILASFSALTRVTKQLLPTYSRCADLRACYRFTIALPHSPAPKGAASRRQRDAAHGPPTRHT
ncbi:hypothetical protein K438DRAFT_1954206 [Mycena galopus ATCC 62051]|nr:hypothetical protein K438DRAFT_1954206 [Mycena galopus ATCC 62051]